MAGYKNTISDINGNVGIGTTAPGEKLEINTAAQSAIMLRARYNANYYTDYGSNQINFTGSNQTFGIKNNGSFAMFINSSSNVGIGTTTANTKLSVDGDLSFLDSNGTTRLTIGNITTGSPFESKIYTGNYHLVLQAQGSGQGDIKFRTGTTSASDRMIINSTGNVGIGTTTPTQKLQIGSTSSGGATTSPDAITLGATYSSVAGSNLKIRVYDSAGSVAGFGVSGGQLDYSTWSTSADHVFYAGGSQLMRIKGNGNVGIGTTGPISKFTVTGTDNTNQANIGHSTQSVFIKVNGTNVDYNASGNSSGSHTFSTGNIERMRITTAGNVGIGTTSPIGKLSVTGGMSTFETTLASNEDWFNSPVSILERSNVAATNLADTYSPNINFHWRSRTSKSLWMNNTGVLGYGEYTAAGVPQYDGTIRTGNLIVDTNVGIGTTNPTAKLHIDGVSGEAFRWAGTGAVYGSLHVGTAGARINVTGANGGYGMSFSMDDSTKMTILPNGNVGIGTTSVAAGYKLQVEGALFTNGGKVSIGLDGTAAEPSLIINDGDSGFFRPSANTIGISTSGAERMRITSGGKVIVGSTNNQTQANLTSRQNGSSIEFGHLNQSGQYYGTLGAMSSSGAPFIAFSADNSTANSFTTRGKKGFVIHQDTNIDGNLAFSSVPLENTANQGLVERMRITSGGNVGIGTTSPASSAKLTVMGNQSFGIPGSGGNTNGRYISIEGNADGSGEGSGRIFFTEHNSTTTSMSDYGMSIGYRGGDTSIIGADGNTWTGLSQISNGSWGMWGHNADATGSLIMYGDRAATYVNLANNDLNNVGSAYFNGNVGIGTTVPYTKLSVVKDITTTAEFGSFGQFTIQGATNASKILSFGFNTATDVGFIQAMVNGTSYNDLLLNARGGNVGIGTTSPSTKLDVSGDLQVNDVYGNKLYTNIGETVANITSYTSSGGVSFQPLDQPPNIYGGADCFLYDYNNGALPIFNVGDQFIIKNSDNSEILLQWDDVYFSDIFTAEGVVSVISGTLTDDYLAEIGFGSASTIMNIDTDLTSTVNVGDEIILGGLPYSVSAITSSSITVSGLVTNIELIDTVDLATDFPLLSYKSSLSDGNNVEKTPILSYNLAKDRTFLRGKIDFFGSNTNQFIGKDSGISNTSGIENTSVGYQALFANTIGIGNTSIGFNSLLSNTTGERNTALGRSALSKNTTGFRNTAIGYEAASNNISGRSLIAIGVQSLFENTTGMNNTAIGFRALESNTTGSNNIAIGYQTMRQFSATDSTAIGNEALGQSGSFCTAIGKQSQRVSRGINNVSVGNLSLSSNSTGANNTSLGYNTQSGNFSGSTILGMDAVATANNQFVVGSAGTNAGAVIPAATSSPTNWWEVVINGTPYKILLHT